MMMALYDKDVYMKLHDSRKKKEGASELASLMSKLFSLNRIEDAKRCSEDEQYRDQLYAEFGMDKA